MTTSITPLSTTILDQTVDVKKRLADLRAWRHETNELDAERRQRLNELESEREHFTDRRALRRNDQKQAQIGILRRRSRVLIVKSPFEVSADALANGGYEAIERNLRLQYALLTKEEKRLWLNNLYFLMTPDIRHLVTKLNQIQQSTEEGDQRNLLIGGESGSGKTRFLDWYSVNHMPVIESEHNRANVIQVEAIKNDKANRSLLQQIVLGCGDNYVDDDSVSVLFNKIGRLFQKCEVKLLMIDELNHLSDETQRRRVLEVSNRVLFTSIVGVAVDPSKFKENSAEIQGRFIDTFNIAPYTGDYLLSLLSFLELLLPFSTPSHLPAQYLTVKEDKKETTVPGLATFIGQKTGSFRYIMRLLKDAAETAIEENLPNITMELLDRTWSNIQS